ncbi:MAG: ATP-binding cassette domain-containing protein [Bacilli bacterium]|nr:ATP-binding cassette domain-containing protein [Bacilli bacterium]
MEIEFKNINLKRKNKYLIKDLNFNLRENEITGIIDESKILKQILDGNEVEGEIILDKDKKIKYIEHAFLTKTVSDEFFLVKKEIDDNNYIEKVISSLNLVGLNKDYLNRNINTLSNFEKTLVMISLSIITNPDVIIFDNVFAYLDKKHKTIIKSLIIELKKKYNKMVIVIDNDINILYEICTYLIIFKNNKLVIDNNMEHAFNDLSIYDEYDLEIPFLIEFSSIANDYGKNIKYHKSINDLIKEVYRNEK